MPEKKPSMTNPKKTPKRGSTGHAKGQSPGPRRRQAILILGVHRSGTSALTRVLSLCGASLPTTLMEAAEINPRGFFESEPIFRLHEEVLSDLGSSWHDLAPLPEGWLQSALIRSHIDAMATLVEEEYGDAPLFVLKDPRICRLVPFWLAVLDRLDVDPVFVLPIRNPLEVAESLQEAEGVDRERGLLIWLNGVLQAEHDSRGFVRSFVDYESLLRDWRSVVKKVSADLSLPFPRLSRRAAAETDAFLSAQLRHHSVSLDEFLAREDVLEWAKLAFGWMGLAISGKKIPTGKIDQLHSAFTEAEKAFGPILARSQLAREEADNAAEKLGSEVSDLSAEHAHLEGQIAPLSDESSRLQTRLEARESQVGELIDCIKLMLVWIASRAPGSNNSSQELEVLLQAMDSSDSASIAETAMEGLRRYQEVMQPGTRDGETIPQEMGIGTSPGAPGADIAKQKQDEERIQLELAEARTENEALEQEVESKKDRINLLIDQVGAKQQLLVQALDELAQSENRHEEIDSNFREIEEELKRASLQTAEQIEARREIDLLLAQERDRSSSVRAERESLLSRLENEEVSASRLAEEKEALGQQVAGLETNLQERETRLLASAEDLEARGREIEALDTRIESLAQERSHLHEELSARNQEFESLEKSVSWRITLPLRYLGIGARKIGLSALLRPIARLLGLGK